MIIENILTTPFMNGVWTAMFGYFGFVVFLASLVMLKNWMKGKIKR